MLLYVVFYAHGKRTSDDVISEATKLGECKTLPTRISLSNLPTTVRQLYALDFEWLEGHRNQVSAMYQSMTYGSDRNLNSNLRRSQGNRPFFSVAQAVSNISSTANNLASSSSISASSSAPPNAFRPPAHKHAVGSMTHSISSTRAKFVCSIICTQYLQGKSLLGHLL